MKAFDFMNSPGLYIEIGQSSLKLLDGDDGLELSLERLANGRLAPLCAERLTSSLRVFLKKHNWRPRLRALCAIGARGVSLRRVTLPACSKDELQRLLLFQIEREFPLPPDDLAWGCCRLNIPSPEGVATLSPLNGERTANGIQELLIVAVKKEVLQEYTELLSGCELIPVFTLGALARSSLCPSSPGTYAVLDIGRTQSELIAFDHGVPSSIRIIPWGGENVTHAMEKGLAIGHAEAEKLKIHFDGQAVSGLDLGQKIPAAISGEVNSLASSIKSNWVGQKLFLTGGSARLKDIAAQLAKSIGNGVECERVAIVPGEGRSAAILGLKRWCEKEEGIPPLILQHTPARDAEGTVRPARWKWAALACLLLIGSLSLHYAEAFFKKPRLSRKLTEIKAYRDKLPKIDRELNFLQYLKTNQPPYLEPIFAMASAAPAGVKIESLSLNRRGDISLRAAMRDSQQVVEFRSKLIDSGSFSTVVVEEQSPAPDRQKIMVRITGQWKQRTDGKSLTNELSRPELEKSNKPGKEVELVPRENIGPPVPPQMRRSSP